MAQESDWQRQQQAAMALTHDILRQQGQGQEPIIHGEDLALLSDMQRRVIAPGGYGVQ